MTLVWIITYCYHSPASIAICTLNIINLHYIDRVSNYFSCTKICYILIWIWFKCFPKRPFCNRWTLVQIDLALIRPRAIFWGNGSSVYSHTHTHTHMTLGPKAYKSILPDDICVNNDICLIISVCLYSLRILYQAVYAAFRYVGVSKYIWMGFSPNDSRLCCGLFLYWPAYNPYRYCI